MSTIVGSKDHFAVEYDMEPLDSSDRMHWLPGHICFWVAGHILGRYEIGAELTVAFASFPHLLANRGRRLNPRLLTLPLLDAFREVYSALHVDTGQTDVEIERAWAQYSPLYAVPTGFDVFDGWMGFLVEDHVRARYMWRDPDDIIREAWLQAGELDNVIDAFLTQLEERTGQKRRSV
jgi:hypothetical protein